MSNKTDYREDEWVDLVDGAMRPSSASFGDGSAGDEQGQQRMRQRLFCTVLRMFILRRACPLGLLHPERPLVLSSLLSKNGNKTRGLAVWEACCAPQGDPRSDFTLQHKSLGFRESLPV